MSDPFVAEVRIFAGNFAPRGWSFCDGQLLSIAQNTALFSLVGTTYGGDGRTNFGLPNLQGRAPMHPGRGPGLTPRTLGQRTGVETVTLTQAQMPNHVHSPGAARATDYGNSKSPQNAIPAMGREQVAPTYGAVQSTPALMASNSTAPVGGGQSHNNLQPFLTLNFIIALVGTYPSRN